jgi:hypothetical protein
MKTSCKNDIIGRHGVQHGQVKLFWDGKGKKYTHWSSLQMRLKSSINMIVPWKKFPYPEIRIPYPSLFFKKRKEDC